MRVKDNQGGTQSSHLKKDELSETFKDVRVWIVYIYILLSSIPNGGLSNFSTSNIAGHTKKVTLNSMTLVSFTVKNILGTQTFQQSQAPGYISGKLSIIATLGALCFMILILRWYNDKLNKGNETILAGMEEIEKVELRKNMAVRDETGRKNVFFRYTH
ncbi:hypothetical protein EYC80_004483 [Monilinia laxa]|uniref:Allantoate permease n=1 Tax=Monilinia laxa TaxID=61186 RepID=A0A5N6KIG0_MONLA|nr:hypothetical protein EYC80_004483 [Monilinia laxa]